MSVHPPFSNLCQPGYSTDCISKARDMLFNSPPPLHVDKNMNKDKLSDPVCKKSMSNAL